MKYFLFALPILFGVQSSFAQTVGPTVVNTTGSSHTEADITYEWSVGELALVETMTGNNVIVTNGLLQSVVSSQITTAGFLVSASNILTPNGDGKNDTWVVKDLDKYPDNEVTVFDRAGRVVYKTKNYQNDWTGYLSGSLLSEDTYYYIIKLKKDGKEGVVKGFITILN